MSLDPSHDPHVHILIADMLNGYAVELEVNGEQYCIVDSTVLDDNPEARASAFEVFLKACKQASRHRAALAN